MGLQLYDRLGNLKAEFQPGDNDAQDKSIQGDNVLSLGFKLYEFMAVDVNDYVDFMGERYWAIERYVPVEKNRMEWEYNFQLYGIESLVKRFLVLRNTDGDDEAVFSLTARPSEHLRLIVECVNRGMGTTTWKAGVAEGEENVVMSYEGTYCDEALRELSDKCGTEWWVDGDTLNLSRCERGEPVALGYGHGLTSIERDKADNAKFYTRLYPIGSSRNIDPERYGSSRLHLPGGLHYVDIDDLVRDYGIVHHYEQSAFSGIYPRRVGRVSSVRSAEVRGTDGNPFEIYYFKDEELDFDPNDYEIGGLVKRVSFQEGSELAGLGVDDDHYFEVNFNSATREFELITIWPYDDGRQLPGGALVPKVGDAYILWNLRMPDEYYRLAEAEFRSAVDAYNLKHTQDVSRYKGSTDHVWIEETGTELQLGRRVRLESAEYFPESGYRLSRITRISRRLNIPSLMDLEVSDALSHGSMDELNDSINDARSYAGSLFGSLRVPDLVRSWETTKPSDSNVLSGKRSMDEFLNKKVSDVAHGEHYEFEGGIDVDGELRVGGDTYHSGVTTHSGKTTHNGKTELNGQTDVNGNFVLPLGRIGRIGGVLQLLELLSDGVGADWTERGRLSGNGRAELRSLALSEWLRVGRLLEANDIVCPTSGEGGGASFSDGLDGSGFRIWKADDGLWHLTADVLTVRREMRVFELLVEQVRSVGGTLVVSSANGRVSEVHEWSGDGFEMWQLAFEGGCSFVRGDVMRCQRWTAERGLKSWSAEVQEVSTAGDVSYVFVNKSDFRGAVPEVGDEVVQWGNTRDTSRQQLIYLSSSEDGSARIEMLTDVTGVGHGSVRVRLGCLDDLVVDGERLSGWGLWADNVYLRGELVVSSRGDTVSHLLSVLEDRMEVLYQSHSDMGEQIGSLELSSGRLEGRVAEIVNDPWGSLLGIEQSELLLRSDFATLFSSRASADGLLTQAAAERYLREVLANYAELSDVPTVAGVLSSPEMASMFGGYITDGKFTLASELRTVVRYDPETGRMAGDVRISGTQIDALAEAINLIAQDLRLRGENIAFENADGQRVLWKNAQGDFVLRSVMQNLIQDVDDASDLVINGEDELDGEHLYVSGLRELTNDYTDSLDVLRCGNVLRLRLTRAHDLYLPYYLEGGDDGVQAYCRTWTRSGGELHLITTEELLSLVGKRVTLITNHGDGGDAWRLVLPNLVPVDGDPNGRFSPVVAPYGGSYSLVRYLNPTMNVITLELKMGLVKRDGNYHRAFWWSWCYGGYLPADGALPGWE